MNRRQFLFVGGGITLATVTGAAVLFSKSSPQVSLSIDQTLKALEALMKTSPSTTGEWSLAKVFQHCAQSIEYSIVGFPEHKSDFFKQTVGAAAFTAFDNIGQMTHNLQEAIPGAPEIGNSAELQGSYLRLVAAINIFKQHSGPLQEHFAFGQLTKAEYERAHIMHINNHLQEVVLN